MSIALLLRSWFDRRAARKRERERNAIMKVANEVFVRPHVRRKPAKPAAYIATNSRLAAEMGKPNPFRASVGRAG